MNKYSYEELDVGMKESFTAVVKEEDMEAFQKICGDINPLHNDDSFARAKGQPSRVVYGMLTASYLSTLAGVYLPGEKSLIHTVDIKLERPVYIGDELTISGEITEKNDTFRLITVKALIKNREGKKVLKAKMSIGVD